jgi:hypothetical protein
MRVTVIQTQTKRKRLDRPVRRTEKQGRRASTARSRGSIRPTRVVSATADTARGKKRLIRWPRWAILRSNGKPLGECRVIRFFWSTLAFLVANAIGLLVAVVLLPGFTIDVPAFVIVVAVFSLLQSVLGPLITKISSKSFPQLMGGIALVTISVGLFVTDIIMEGMEIGGIANWLAATLLVWIGSLVASILLPIYVFKQLPENAKNNG